ncbi:MAG: hypothetical protein KKE96_02065, partial [Candidatus Altiarchaeota archaeon]|nr:hypothetical protein [Candidatus Altiarchaeota archaeon]
MAKRDKFVEKEGKEKSGFKPVYIIPALLVIAVVAFFVLSSGGPEAAEDIGGADDGNGVGNSGNTNTDSDSV